MIDSNYLIINKKAQRFGSIRIAGHVAVFLDSADKPLNYGVLSLDDAIYAIMCCDEFHAIAFVIDRGGSQTVEIAMWRNDDDYGEYKRRFAEITGRRLSVQDYKYSSYAWLIAGKLGEGNHVKVVDAADESKMAVCPECGMLNPAGSPYCLDCGAEIA